MRSTDLVVEGDLSLAGVAALAGAVAGLAEEYSFRRVAGTGAGAVIAALVASGLEDRLEQLVLGGDSIGREPLPPWIPVPERLAAPDDGTALRVRLTEPLTSARTHAPTAVEAPEVLDRTVYVDSSFSDDLGLLFDEGLRAAAYFLCEKVSIRP
jgi:hypothetical protein